MLDSYVACPDLNLTRTFGNTNIVIVLDRLLIGTHTTLPTRSASGSTKLSYSEGLLAQRRFLRESRFLINDLDCLSYRAQRTNRRLRISVNLTQPILWRRNCVVSAYLTLAWI